MPELPEVESIRLQLQKYVVGHKITDVEVRYGKKFEGDKEKAIGTRILDIRRFGKVLVIDLSNDYSIVVHIKLTGQLIYRGPNLINPPNVSGKVNGGLGGKHTHVIFHLDRKGKLYYNDVRKFGWIKIVKSLELKDESEFIGKLGPEPLVIVNSSGQAPLDTKTSSGQAVLTLKLFKNILSKTNRSIKTVLMDQEKISGVGNIYANDALWLAHINPRTPAKNLGTEEQKNLYDAVHKVLKDGLKYGGASELSFVTPDGREGEYQNHTLVYGHEGEPCENCHKQSLSQETLQKSKIEKFFLSGRGTYFCPVCQK